MVCGASIGGENDRSQAIRKPKVSDSSWPQRKSLVSGARAPADGSECRAMAPAASANVSVAPERSAWRPTTAFIARSAAASDGVAKTNRARLANDPTCITFARGPQEIESERLRTRTNPDHRSARDSGDGDRGTFGTEHASHCGRQRSDHLVSPRSEREMLERTPAVPKPGHAARQVDREAQPDERDEELLDVAEAQGQRAVELEAQPPLGDRQPEGNLGNITVPLRP